MRWLPFLATLVVLSLILSRAAAATPDSYEEDEFEGDDSEFAQEPVETIPPPPPSQQKAASKPVRQQAEDDEEEFAQGYDEDEFHVEDPVRTSEPFTIKSVELKNNRPATNPNAPFTWIALPKHYWMEGSFIVFIILFVVNYFIGRSANMKVAAAWAINFKDLFVDQFAQVGNPPLIKEAQHAFRMTASGRINCQGLQVNLRLKKRQDLTTLIYDLYSPTYDTMDVTVIMNEEAMEPMVLAVVPRRDERTFKKETRDVEHLAKNITFENLNPKLSVLSDSKDVAKLFIADSTIRGVLDANPELVRYIHLTDQWTSHKVHHKVVRMSFKIPSPVAKMENLVKLVFYIIDLTAGIKLNSEERSKGLKLRAKLRTQLFKEAVEEEEEALAKKKEDKRKQEQQDMSKLTPEQREKLELKKAKRDQKRKERGMMKVVRM